MLAHAVAGCSSVRAAMVDFELVMRSCCYASQRILITRGLSCCACYSKATVLSLSSMLEATSPAHSLQSVLMLVACSAE
jgi:hypothetical protein